ncbi:hypothetical protein BSPWISOX_2607 [uncultured Gammaproteobacteria bacterium]|nr:hypothetical protein BSPWISOX_2607 [uncultured Gammaproteobacteria bacterium]
MYIIFPSLKKYYSIINVLKINIKELRLLKIQTHKTTNKHLRTPQTS